MDSGWCVPDGVLLAWCAASRAADPDAPPLPPPWEAFEPAAVPGMGAPPLSSTTLYLASLVPLLVLLYHRLCSRADDHELLPLPLAVAVACRTRTLTRFSGPDPNPNPDPDPDFGPGPRQVASLTPSLMLHPAAGILASVLLNTLLLLHLRETAPPPAAASAYDDAEPADALEALPAQRGALPPLTSDADVELDRALARDGAPPPYPTAESPRALRRPPTAAGPAAAGLAAAGFAAADRPTGRLAERSSPAAAAGTREIVSPREIPPYSPSRAAQADLGDVQPYPYPYPYPYP